MNTNDQPLYVLEWSKRQNCFHVQPLSDLLADNLTRFYLNRPGNDYAPIAVGTRQELDPLADQLRAAIIRREKVTA